MIHYFSIFFKAFKKESDRLKTAAIIAEYNPFHSGHKYIINHVKKHGAECVIAVMSGNFVQRGDIAILSKFDRTKMALLGGADLVVELPTPFAMSTAQNFALGGIFAAKNLGANMLAFGSESGNLESIKKTAAAVYSPLIKPELGKALKSGKTFAAARAYALNTVFGNAESVSTPNDALAVEYIAASTALNIDLEFLCVQRLCAQHDQDEVNGHIASASAIRKFILNNDLDSAIKYIPPQCRDILIDAYNSGKIADINRIESAILCKLRTLNKFDFSDLADISEGLENRIFAASRTAGSLEELYSLAKTKRYSHARIRRLVLSAFLGVDNTYFKKPLPYIRVLGFNETGNKALQNARDISQIPIIMRATELKGNPLFETECRATDIYSLAQKFPSPCGEEYRNGIIKQP